MITQFVPGRTFRYVGEPASKDTLCDYPALSGLPVRCLKALEDYSSFDCDLSSEALAKYDLCSWEEAESKEEEGFTIQNPFIPKPKRSATNLLHLWNMDAFTRAERTYAIQQRIEQKMEGLFPSDRMTSVDGSTVLGLVEDSIYELLKEGVIDLSDVLGLATMQATQITQGLMSAMNKESEALGRLLRALGEQGEEN
jgi:hypothetical protein